MCLSETSQILLIYSFCIEMVDVLLCFDFFFVCLHSVCRYDRYLIFVVVCFIVCVYIAYVPVHVCVLELAPAKSLSLAVLAQTPRSL